jgi:Txe/YoeB family toxin of Txe-Axe toxin-antitoxin module
METVFEVENFEQLVEAINKDPFAEAVAPEKVHVERYVRDERIGWDTYLVTIDGRGVWGMTNGALK